MTNPFAALAEPLINRPGLAVKDPVRSERGRAANEAKKERKFPEVPNPWALTGAEWACLQALTSGAYQRDAAKGLFMSPKTMQTHLGRAKEKMGAANTVHMALMFDRWARATPNMDVEVVLRFVAGRPTVEMRDPE